MKKIYLKPEMELTECIMLRTGICSSQQQQNPNELDPFGSAPARKVF